jgi:glycosyltransferase involved in cell wall biosynthesis
VKAPQRTIKVAHVTTVGCTLRYGLLNQLVAIQQAGYEVCTISAPDKDVPPVEAAGFRHIPVAFTRRMTPFADARALWRLYQTFRREQFDIVHTHNPKPGLLGQLAARMAGVPIVVNTLHGFYFHEHTPRLVKRLHIALETIAGFCSDVILSQSAEDVATAVRERICAPRKIRQLGNGIDVRRFNRRNLDPDRTRALRRSLGIAGGDRVVGFVGRLVEEKGLLELMEAARLLRSAAPGLKFLIVGPVDHEKADALLPAVAATYEVSDACIFTGRREDMPELYGLMDVFVLPSHREGFPRSLMEASAMGVPCIATDIRGCREAVTPGVNGLLVPVRDARALADAIGHLLGDPAKAADLGERGVSLARRQFDEEHIFDDVLSEYARLSACVSRDRDTRDESGSRRNAQTLTPMRTALMRRWR